MTGKTDVFGCKPGETCSYVKEGVEIGVAMGFGMCLITLLHNG